MAVDGLGVDPILAEARHEDGLRDLPLAEAGDLDALGEVGQRVLHRVLHLVRRDVDRESHAVLSELLDGRGHTAIQPARVYRPPDLPLGPAGLRRAPGAARGTMLHARIPLQAPSRRTRVAF